MSRTALGGRAEVELAALGGRDGGCPGAADPNDATRPREGRLKPNPTRALQTATQRGLWNTARRAGDRGSMTDWLPRALAVAVLVAITTTGTSAHAKSGPLRTHQFLLLPVLAVLPPLTPPGPYPEAESAVANCDAGRLTALIRIQAPIPTTGGRLPATICAALRERTSSSRLLVAPLAGSRQIGTPAGLSGRDVRAAKPFFSRGVGYAVDLTLTSSGLRRQCPGRCAVRSEHASRRGRDRRRWPRLLRAGVPGTLVLGHCRDHWRFHPKPGKGARGRSFVPRADANHGDSRFHRSRVRCGLCRLWLGLWRGAQLSRSVFVWWAFHSPALISQAPSVFWLYT